MKKFILLGVVALTGCKGSNEELVKALADVEKKCAKPVSLSVTYAPNLFGNGSLTLTCSQLKPDTIK